MPDIYYDVDAALAEVPVNLFPLLDDTDFKTIEAAVAYNAAGLALYWHFVTTTGAYTVTAVTPTTLGAYDWVNQGAAGIYTIEIPASGGVSINNDTEGFGWFTGVCTGVLPWRGPVIGFRAAGINDKLCDSAYDTARGLAGTALPAAAAAAAGGLPISGAGGLDLDAKLANTNEVTAARMGALTDWIDAGRLDLILDAIAAHVAGLNGAAMRGTDSAALAASYTATRAAYIDKLNVTGTLAHSDAAATYKATGFSTHAAADVWAVVTRVLTANTNLNDPTAVAIASQVRTELAIELARIDAAITTRHASGAAVAKSPATLASGDVTGNLAADVKAWNGGALPTIGTSTLDAAGVRTAVGMAAANLDTQLAAKPSAAEIKTALEAAGSHLALILAAAGTDGVVVAAASKTGYALSATGLDAVAVTAPAGPAATFREMLVQTWRRFFKKATKTGSQIVTYADDGTTPITTQAISDDGTTETQEVAT